MPRKFLWDQERQLWDEFQRLDKNRDGVIDAEEMRNALARQGVELPSNAAADLVRLLSGTPDKEHVTFAEFRDFLILLPRRATPFEIYKFYQVHKRFSDGRGAARVNMDGDPILSFPKAPGSPEHSTAQGFFKPHEHHDDENPVDDLDNKIDVDEEDEDYYEPETRHEAWRFLLAGGIAGGVSRSVTAPFDRLKIFLMTSANPIAATGKPTPWRAAHGLMVAVGRIYKEGGGIKAFWVGNGLNVLKIFPESAIKFVSYEQSKRFLAKYWDGVTDPADISSKSRFIAGGIGGITSQLAIYGLETLKTRVQSNLGPSQGWRSIQKTSRIMWREGGLRTFYRGLGVSEHARAAGVQVEWLGQTGDWERVYAVAAATVPVVCCSVPGPQTRSKYTADPSSASSACSPTPPSTWARTRRSRPPIAGAWASTSRQYTPCSPSARCRARSARPPSTRSTWCARVCRRPARQGIRSDTRASWMCCSRRCATRGGAGCTRACCRVSSRSDRRWA